MKIACDFYPYAGTLMAAIGSREALEHFLMKSNVEINRKTIKNDQARIKAYLDKNPSVLMVKVRQKEVPAGSVETKKLMGKYFEAYLHREIAMSGRFRGSNILVLYLKPKIAK